MAYFALSEYYSPVPELDEWIDGLRSRADRPLGNLRLSVSGRPRPSARRRVRMCYWKQWRRCRKRVRELLKRGVSERQAVRTALSRKSYWHLSRKRPANPYPPLCPL